MSDLPAVYEDVTGVILVGGRSSRMGRDKMLVRLADGPILHHMRSLLEPHVPEILLVGHHRPEFDELNLRVIEDLFPDAGPLGGIFTALTSVTNPYVFVLAGDMPFLSASLIRSIIEAREEAEAVIPRGPRGPEPLCAVYSRSCVGQIHASLEKGNRRILTALEEMTVIMPDIDVKDSERDPFFNINYPEDLEKAGKL